MMLSFLRIIYEPEKGAPGETTMTEQISVTAYHDKIASLAPALRERAGEAEKLLTMDEEDIIRKAQLRAEELRKSAGLN